MKADYDLIVIGSGMGGLTVASLAAQRRGYRVMVLERHWCCLAQAAGRGAGRTVPRAEVDLLHSDGGRS